MLFAIPRIRSVSILGIFIWNCLSIFHKILLNSSWNLENSPRNFIIYWFQIGQIFLFPMFTAIPSGLLFRTFLWNALRFYFRNSFRDYPRLPSKIPSRYSSWNPVRNSPRQNFNYSLFSSSNVSSENFCTSPSTASSRDHTWFFTRIFPFFF